jgi:adenosine deaminase
MAPSGTDTELCARLRALPKVDLHRHLEGALRPETLWEFHRARGESRHASLAALREALVVPPGVTPGFLGFLARFDALRFHYGGAAEIERLGREAVCDAADDGVVHLELRFSPAFLAARMLREPALPPPPAELVERSAEALVQGARDEATRRGLSLVFILCLGRHAGVEGNRAAAELLDRPIGANFVAVDVAGDESVPVETLDELLLPWRRAGRALTLHAGEDARGDGPARVRAAVLRHGAARIGHGVRSSEDAATTDLLRARRVPLEMCITSNVQTGAARSYEAHPWRELQRAGVTVTLNSDDPTISGITLSEEYARARELGGATWAELRTAAVEGARVAFLPPAERESLMQRIATAWDGIL